MSPLVSLQGTCKLDQLEGIHALDVSVTIVSERALRYFYLQIRTAISFDFRNSSAYDSFCILKKGEIRTF